MNNVRTSRLSNQPTFLLDIQRIEWTSVFLLILLDFFVTCILFILSGTGLKNAEMLDTFGVAEPNNEFSALRGSF